jgi:hypothetical protein
VTNRIEEYHGVYETQKNSENMPCRKRREKRHLQVIHNGNTHKASTPLGADLFLPQNEETPKKAWRFVAMNGGEFDYASEMRDLRQNGGEPDVAAALGVGQNRVSSLLREPCP